MDPVRELFERLNRDAKALSVAFGARDRHTWLHSRRVVRLALALGARVGLDGVGLGALGLGAVFHDVGKIGIPDDVLLKRGSLGPAERRIVRRHPGIGERIVRSTGLAGAPAAAKLVRHHHEHFDGGGYPDGLGGNAIPLGARVISIADGYDAMTDARAYHQQRSHEQVMAVLVRETGGKYHPALMAEFRRLIETSPLRAGRG